MPYDAIVIGAGPGGSTAAHRLAASGADVLLLDRATFPRDKPCGGAVTMRALKHAPVDITPVVEHVVTIAELRLGFRRTAERGKGGPLAYMTQRSRLDAFLAEHAALAGAEFRDGVKVTAVETDERGAVVTAGGERLHARTVIGADGVNGISARSLGLGGNRSVGVALEGNLPNAKIDVARYRGRFILELDTVPGGYGWIFPKGDHVNVGVGGWGTEGPRLRDHLRVLCDHYGIELTDLQQLRGHRMPMRRPETHLAGGRALLVGDAAGVIDPVSGDGIYEALVTARLAAEHIVGDELQAYDKAVRRRLDPLASAGWGAKKALDRFPRAVFAIMRLPVTWRVLEKLLVGEVAHPGEARGAGRTAMKLIQGLARAA